MKQTAVEYITEMIKLNDKEFYAMLFEDKVFEQAKAMEKEQLIMFGAQCMVEVEKQSGLGAIKIYELYYNEIFKSE